MNRDIAKLGNEQFDLCVIGGGIYGTWVARDAAQRGLSVALIEKGDFASSTSANSLKTIHGGFRYLQHADFKRMRESISERKNLMRVAPHLVHPMPVLVPSYGSWRGSKGLAGVALLINDLIGFDRNRLIDPQKHIPSGRFMSARETVDILPGIERKGLTGSIEFYDAQVQNSERLIISLVHSAVKDGAVAANYVAASGFITSGKKIIGVRAKDVFGDAEIDIRAHTVVNTAGPWMDCVLDLLNGNRPNRRLPLEKAFNLVLKKSIFDKYSVGVSSKNCNMEEDALIDRGNRFFFFSSWRDRTIVGTKYLPFDGNPDDMEISSCEIDTFLTQVNRALPTADLSLDDVSFVLSGVLPSSGVSRKTGEPLRARQYSLFDHRNDGIDGLISVMGVKYTTARGVAEKTVDLVFDTWNRKAPASQSSNTPIHGGNIPGFDDLLVTASRDKAAGLGESILRRLASTYGTAYTDVLRQLERSDCEVLSSNEENTVMKAEVLYAIREELALTLADVIFRRMDVGSAGHPGRDVLRECAGVMGDELHWDHARIQKEIENVERRYPQVPVAAGA